MSKYNLTDILNEYIGGGRIGTLNISFRDLLDKMDDLEKSGKVIVRTLSGPSGDGKVNREFEVIDRDSAVPGGKKQERGFTVYDYKFGFDPGSEEHFMEEYDFSVGGNDLNLAMDLIPDVVPYRLGEEKSEDKLNEGDLFSSEFDRRELKDIINDLNKGLILDMPTRRAYKFLVSLLDKEDKEEMGLNEQMYIDDDEFEMEMGRSKKDSLKKEMIIHVDQLIDGNIDMNDFMNVVEDIMAEVNSLKESTGPSDKAETEDDVVNVDKVAGPGAKGRNYGAETSANTAEDDMEDKEIANPKPMYEDMKLVKLAKKMGIDVDDLKKRIKKMSDTEKDKIEADAFSRSAMAEESDSFVDELQESTQEESVAKYIKDYYRNPKTGKSMISDDIVMEYYRTHKDWDQEGRWDGSKEGMRDGMEDFNEFFDANYGYMFDDSRDIDEDLKKHFKRFM